MLGGMSWESTGEYYRLINERVAAALGGIHSAKIYIASMDLDEIKVLMDADDWDEIAQRLSVEARTLEMAGSDCILIATNTIHKVADQIASAVNVPLIHIADTTAKAIQEVGATQVGLLGTKYTMNGGFLQERLRERHGISTSIPDPKGCEIVDDAIFDELVLGEFHPDTRARFVGIIENLARDGAEAVVLGCTEIPMLVKNTDTKVPLIDATTAHAHAAADFALDF